MVVLGFGSGSMGGFETRFYATLTDRELGSSHERPIQADVRLQIGDAVSPNIIIAGGN